MPTRQPCAASSKAMVSIAVDIDAAVGDHLVVASWNRSLDGLLAFDDGRVLIFEAWHGGLRMSAI